jgi:mannose-6-phosphate isomerase-like protein (cupin superfamily)
MERDPQVEEVTAARSVPDVPVVRDRTTAEHYTWGHICEGWRLLDRPGLTVIQEHMPPGTAERRHLHARARQLFFVLEGELQIERDLTVYRLGAGQALEISPNVPHCVRNTTSADVSFLVISAPSAQRDRTNLESRPTGVAR